MSDAVSSYLPMYINGAFVGAGLTVLVMALATLIGLAVALGKVSPNRTLRGIFSAYTIIFRGTPPLVLLYIVYFGIPSWVASTDNDFLKAIATPLDNRILAVVIAMTLVVAAYSAEIIRAAIQSIHADQMEAARSIGMSRMKAMRHIILPQAFRTAVPPMASEFVVTLKGTSLTSVIGVTELTRAAQITASATFHVMEAYMLAAFFYIVMVTILQSFVTWIERRLVPSSSRKPGFVSRVANRFRAA